MNKKAQGIAAIIVIIVIVIIAAIVLGYFYLSPMNNINPAQTPQTNTPVINTPSTTHLTSTPATNTPSTPKTYEVDIKNFAFNPSTLTIKKGDTIIWTNNDDVAHTVTSDSGSELDSSSLSKGTTYSHTFESSGEFDYHCMFHLMMKGKVVVE